MRTASLAVAVPSEWVGNEDILAEICSESTGVHFDGIDGDFERTLRVIDTLLRRNGSNTRTRCAPDETPLDLTLEACREAIAKLPSGQKRVDRVIFASVFGFLHEPSSAALLANRLGLHDAHVLDVKQACDGFMYAAELAELLLDAGKAERILVVNAEFPWTSGFAIHPKRNFRLSSPEQVERVFPAYTVGDIASAVVLEKGGESWNFERSARNDLAELCTLTPDWLEAAGVESESLAPDGTGVFTSYGSHLWKHGHPEVVDLFRRSGIDPTAVDMLFTHSSSPRDWREIASDIGLADKLYDIAGRYGNVVSAAIPAALATAEKEGVLTRGMRVVLLVGSAGMSFSVAQFTF